MGRSLRLSVLKKTWLLDIDGVIFPHSRKETGPSDDSGEVPLPGVVDFIKSLPKGDRIVLLTARKSGRRRATEVALRKFGIRYDALIMNLPTGERILINDTKPAGLRTAIAVNLSRNEGLRDFSIIQDSGL